MTKRILCLAAALLLLCGTAAAEFSYTWKEADPTTTYDSPTLRYTISKAKIDSVDIFVTRVWVQDPARQIRKASSAFHEHLASAEDLAKKIPGAALVVNGSGYVSRMYPWIPENYPGKSEDYWYAPLGSLTITDGKVLRDLEGVPYYGLTLEPDGLHLYAGEDNDAILARGATQTWAFYVECPLIMDGEIVLDRSWDFANKAAIRNVIAQTGENEYVILTCKRIRLTDLTDVLYDRFHPEWAFNLDGGPSASLIRRRQGSKTLKLVFGADQKIVDVMGFVELTDENP